MCLVKMAIGQIWTAEYGNDWPGYRRPVLGREEMDSGQGCQAGGELYPKALVYPMTIVLSSVVYLVIAT